MKERAITVEKTNEKERAICQEKTILKERILDL
jgi:hypothetical protein